VTDVLPWHRAQWSRIAASGERGHFPHALLLHGRPGLGKQVFARELAQGLLCASPPAHGRPCGHCRACQLFLAGTHPDAVLVEPEEAGKAILIEHVRGLTRVVGLKSSQGGNKVAVIAPAESMNRNAANSLLKTLEEPPDDTVLLLVSHAPALLPATVRSRCQRLAFRTPSPVDVGPWLADRLPAGSETGVFLRLANGSPFRALELARDDALAQRGDILRDLRGLAGAGADPVATAADWHRLGLKPVGDWMYSLVTDLIRLKHGASRPEIVNGDAEPELRALSAGLDLRLLFNMLDKCLEMRRVLERHLNLNHQCLLEDLAMAWAGV